MKASKNSFVVSPYAKLTKRGKSEPIKVTIRAQVTDGHILVCGTTSKGPY